MQSGYHAQHRESSFNPDVRSSFPARPAWPAKDAALPRIIEALEGAVTSIERPSFVTAIAGGSCSGKTSQVADRLITVFKSSTELLSLDDYSIGAQALRRLRTQNRSITWDDPEYIDIAGCASDIDALRSGVPVPRRCYNFKNGGISVNGEHRPAAKLLVEGLFALYGDLLQSSDLKVFVQASTHSRFMRRLLRDIQRTSMSREQILRYFADVVEPKHQELVQPQIFKADIVVQNEYDPKQEAVGAVGFDIQLKARGSLDSAAVARLGGIPVETIIQRDEYLSPQDHDLRATGEIVRLRREVDAAGRPLRASICYKGPSADLPIIVRPRLDFDVSPETVRAIKSLYCGGGYCIEKCREIFRLGECIIACDRGVTRTDASGAVRLGNFVEFQARSQGYTAAAAKEGQVPEHCLDYLRMMMPLQKALGLERATTIPEEYGVL